MGSVVQRIGALCASVSCIAVAAFGASPVSLTEAPTWNMGADIRIRGERTQNINGQADGSNSSDFSTFSGYFADDGATSGGLNEDNSGNASSSDPVYFEFGMNLNGLDENPDGSQEFVIEIESGEFTVSTDSDDPNADIANTRFFLSRATAVFEIEIAEPELQPDEALGVDFVIDEYPIRVESASGSVGPPSDLELFVEALDEAGEPVIADLDTDGVIAPGRYRVTLRFSQQTTLANVNGNGGGDAYPAFSAKIVIDPADEPAGIELMDIDEWILNVGADFEGLPDVTLPNSFDEPNPVGNLDLTPGELTETGYAADGGTSGGLNNDDGSPSEPPSADDTAALFFGINTEGVDYDAATGASVVELKATAIPTLNRNDNDLTRVDFNISGGFARVDLQITTPEGGPPILGYEYRLEIIEGAVDPADASASATFTSPCVADAAAMVAEGEIQDGHHQLGLSFQNFNLRSWFKGQSGFGGSDDPNGDPSATMFTARLTLVPIPDPRIWDNGLGDEAGASLSQGDGPVRFRTADDFLLPRGRACLIDNVVVEMAVSDFVTDPAFQLEFYEDCDGLPGDQLDPTGLDPNALPGLITEFEAEPVGPAPFSTDLTLWRVTFPVGRCVDTPGRFWLSPVGLGETGEFFWVTSGRGVVQGAQGAVRTPGTQPLWVPGSRCPCSGVCSDYAFRIFGVCCRFAHRAGLLALGETAPSSVSASPDDPFGPASADDFHLPPGAPQELCKVTVWYATNCDPATIRGRVFANACDEPGDDLIDLGAPAEIEDITFMTGPVKGLPVYRVEWRWGPEDDAPVLPGGSNYWLVVDATGGTVIGSDGCWLLAEPDGPCARRFNEARNRNFELGFPEFTPLSEIPGASPGFDHAFEILARRLER